MLAGSCLTEECIERIITTTDRLVAWHLAIGLDPMLKAKELPARIANLDTALAEMKAENFTHDRKLNGGDKLSE
jgi:hypothetical protein